MILDTSNMIRGNLHPEENALKQQLDLINSTKRREIDNIKSEYSQRINEISRMREMHNSRMLEDIEYTSSRLQQERSQSLSLEQEISKISLNNDRELDSLQFKLSEKLTEIKQIQSSIHYQKEVEIKLLNEDIDFIQQDLKRSFDMQNRDFRIEIEELSDRRESQTRLIINLTSEVEELKRQLYLKQEDTDRIATLLERHIQSLRNSLESNAFEILKFKEDSDDARCYSANMISESGRSERMLSIEMDENAELKERFNKLQALVYGKNKPKKRS